MKIFGAISWLGDNIDVIIFLDDNVIIWMIAFIFLKTFRTHCMSTSSIKRLMGEVLGSEVYSTKLADS
jgi:hypothetical protein